MRPPRTRWSRATLPAVLLAVLATSACHSAAPRGVDTTPSPSSTAPASDFEALYRARKDSARTRFTPADVHFMTGMIGHHAQAITMSKLAPTHGASPAVQTLAARIINAQQDEIATMQRWLRERGQPVPELHVMGNEVMVHGAEHDMHMPGMLTPEQMRALDAARGIEFDRLFLSGMIQHHRGAVTMVHDLFATDGAGQDDAVFKFASDVQVDQNTEIARMEQMLAALPAAGRAP
jgi:uncharacterized protein (DUF305 family)